MPDEGMDGLPGPVGTAEDPTMDGLFFRAVEALGDAIGLRFGNEGKARHDAPKVRTHLCRKARLKT